MTEQFTPPRQCAVPCLGTPGDCSFGVAVDRLARLPHLTPDEVAVERQIGKWCVLVADGILSAHDLSTITTEAE